MRPALPTLAARVAALEIARPAEGPSTLFYDPTIGPPEVVPAGCTALLPRKDEYTGEPLDVETMVAARAAGRRAVADVEQHDDEQRDTAEQPEQPAPETVTTVAEPDSHVKAATPEPAPAPAPKAEPKAFGSIARGAMWPDWHGRLW